MKRALFVSLVLANAIVLAGPDTLIRHEDFNSAWSPSSPPTDWRIVYSGGSGGDTWNRRTGFPWTGNSTAYAGIWFATSSNHTDSLISPLLDCSRVRNITLRCSTYFLSRVAAAYTARILYSDDSGTTWRVVRDYANDSFGPGREVISLDTIGLRRNVFLAWVWSGDLANINWWCLDNVTVTGQAVRDTDITAKKVLRPERIELPGLPFHPSAIFQNIGT
ncbi:MAG: choice-of-anchor J domain-containing protein, partial [candidate division WOR-3 bacterium]